MSLVSEWKNVVMEKMTLKEAVKDLNLICNLKLTSSNLIEIEKGLRPLPTCASWIMMNMTISKTLNKYYVNGYVKSDKYIEFIDALSPPPRTKK